MSIRRRAAFIDRPGPRQDTIVSPFALLLIPDMRDLRRMCAWRKVGIVGHRRAVVVEGEVVLVTDEIRLQRLADAYISKYDDLFVFHVRDKALWIEGSEDPGLAFEVRPTKAFGFGKAPYSQTRWRF